MLNSRIKGQIGEREACTLLGTIIGQEGLTRNLEQVRSGGADIIDIPGLCIEVKRQETVTVPAWWRQVVRAADNRGATPVLMYRQNRKPWQFCIPAYFLLPKMSGYITLDQQQFSIWLREWYNTENRG